MAIHRLRDPVAVAFHAWVAASAEHAAETLEFREIRRGLQALLGGRPGARGARALDGAGKRAAMACFVAPLEFLAAHLAARALLGSGAPRRVIDIACGFGATGAGIATAFDAPPPLVGVERDRRALSELARTWRAFDLDGRHAPAAPRGIGRGDLVCVGCRPGSPVGDARQALAARVTAATRRGATVLVLEPDDFADPAWRGLWTARLAPLGARSERLRPAIERPPFVRRMDKAARLDHQRIAMRVLLVDRDAG